MDIRSWRISVVDNPSNQSSRTQPTGASANVHNVQPRQSDHHPLPNKPSSLSKSERLEVMRAQLRKRERERG